MVEQGQEDPLAQKRSQVRHQRIEEAKTKMYEDPEWVGMFRLEDPQEDHTIDGAARAYAELRLPFPKRRLTLSSGEEIEIEVRNVFTEEDWEAGKELFTEAIEHFKQIKQTIESKSTSPQIDQTSI
jgi:hypothetical protein